MAEGESSGSRDNGGIYALLIVVVILILGVALYFSGMFGNGDPGDTNIDVNVETPAVPGDGDGGGGPGT